MAVSISARLQRKDARTVVSAAAAHSFRRCYGIQFTDRKTDRLSFEHIFDRICRENDIEHRLTKVNHPWTNGQIERMNRTLKDATVKRYNYDNHDQFEQHLQTFLAAYNYAKRLKTLKGLRPHEYICKCWTETPDRFRMDPTYHTVGLNT